MIFLFARTEPTEAGTLVCCGHCGVPTPQRTHDTVWTIDDCRLHKHVAGWKDEGRVVGRRMEGRTDEWMDGGTEGCMVRRWMRGGRLAGWVVGGGMNKLYVRGLCSRSVT